MATGEPTVERRRHESLLSRALATLLSGSKSKGEEATRPAEEEELLGGAVDFDRDQLLVGADQLPEERRLGRGFFIGQTGIGVVDQDDEGPLARQIEGAPSAARRVRRRWASSRPDSTGSSATPRRARRPRLSRGLGQGLRIKSIVFVARSRRHLGAGAQSEALPVIAPKRRRDGYFAAFTAEEIGHERQTVGQPIGDERQARRHRLVHADALPLRASGGAVQECPRRANRETHGLGRSLPGSRSRPMTAEAPRRRGRR